MKCPLPRTTPESQGVNPAAVTAYIQALKDADLEVHGFMLLRHGNVVAEGWRKPYSPELQHMLFSLSKSFTSIAIGFAAAEGLLRVEDPVLKFFPEHSAAPGPYWQELTVHHLLCMSTGHAEDTTGPMQQGKDWAAGFFAQPLTHRPGTHFLYNSGASYLLSVIVQKLTGQRVLDYLTPRLFEPLGIEGATWEQCPLGYDTGGWGLMLRLEEVAKFGQWLLQRGLWQGRQLIPAEWVDAATSKQTYSTGSDGIDHRSDWDFGYGYQFWMNSAGGYRADGAFGQFSFVLPHLDAVVAMNCGSEPDKHRVLKLLWSTMLPGMGEPIPEDPVARAEMQALLASLEAQPPQATAEPDLAARLDGNTYLLQEAPSGIQSLRFAFSGDTCHADIGFGHAVDSTDFGLNRWLVREEDHPLLGRCTSASAYAWQAGKLVLVKRPLETPFIMSLEAEGDGENISVRVLSNTDDHTKEVPPVKGILKK